MNYAVSLFLLLLSGVALAAPFEKAVPVWAEGKATEMNSRVRFRTAFESAADCGDVLRVTGANAYRIRLNGTFVGYGPARAPKGFFRTDEWPLDAAIRRGRNELEIEAAGYNCNSFCFQDQPAFLQAEVVCGGKVVAATGTDGDFVAETTERIRKVPRYSFQRMFAEAYRLGGGEPEKLALERRPPVRYLERIASYPTFEANDRVRIVSRAKAEYDPAAKPKNVFFVETDGKNPQFKAFAKSGLEANPWDDMQKVRFSSRTPCAGGPGAAFALKDGESAMADAGLNDCGFFGMTVKVTKPGRILFTFDEVLTDGEVDPTRMTCCNCVEWRFEQPGSYVVETFEPYVFRYANLIAVGGAFEISGLHVRTYKNPDAGRASFRCSDPAYGKIFAAARETFVQNAVDVFTDCPSRERAGWLCDSFFIGRVNALLTGDTKLERLFLQNFAVSDGFENHPAGAIPMCYPADELRGRFIPNWAMWLVIEVEEYLKRSGDRATVDALRPRLVAFVDYMKTFRNPDGLLEKLPSWVFVEWSQANKLVQDVNYPSNMTWAEVLDAMNRLYGMPELAAEAEKVRETVRRQSWTGKWFCDNAVRQPDGTLKLSGECTETCQYYAFFFRTATPKTHPELWKTLVDDFGPKRLAADGKTLRSHPEIWPSNAFIGNYLRLECLAREGLVRNVLDETKGFFLYMAERTGTLWEMISPTASCDHGFASHAAVYLFRDVIGIRSVDAKTRKVVVEPPEGLDLDWVEGTLPVSPTETVTVGWRRGEKPTVRWNVHVDFARGKWNADDWTLVKSPRWDYCHGFTQKDGWIENETPDVSAEDVHRKFNSKSYSGMVLKEKAKLGQAVATTTGWDWLMAPLIVIAPELGVAKDGKTAEFRDHWEIVVYNQGINVWHHFWSSEKGPSHFKAAALVLPEREHFKPNEKHTFTVKIQRNRKNRKEMVCTCGGYTLQYDDDSLPDEFYAGIIGCEGRNFFWDFSVR